MKLNRSKRAARLLCIMLAPVFLTGCPGLDGTGSTTNDNSGGFDGGGSGERPLTDVCFPTGAGGGEAPTGELVFPIDGATITSTPASFLFRGSDPDGDPLAITVFVSDQANVFETSPIAELSCASAEDLEDLEELLEINVPNPASFFWGIEISDGLNTIQRPADGVGVPFSTIPSSSLRSGLDGVALICPRQGLPARAVTTFQWSLGGFVPTRAQVFVGRANQTSPFDSPLRIFEVIPQSATSLAIAPSEALPLGEPLTWGLRVEAGNGVSFTLGGSAGETFTPQANVPPSGSLLSPSNDSMLTDAAESFLLAWEVDAGNCEDESTSTVFLERLGSNSAPVAIFDSPIQLQVDPDSQETNIVSSLAALSFDAGVWAWAVRTTDGTDQAELQDSDDAERGFRTFLRNTRPRFVSPPIVETGNCGVGNVDTIAFSYTDDNGVESVSVSVSFSTTEASVFNAQSATLPIEDPQGTVRIALAGLDTSACTLFANGRGFYGVELQDGANPAVRSTVFYPGPPPPPPPRPRGACCDPDGFCTDDVAQSDCAGEFDRFGANILCDSGDSEVPWCRPALGACCENGECFTSDRINCEKGFDATWFIGADCDDTGNFTCPQPVLGSCCSDGFCNGLTGEDYCAGEIGGEWFVDEDCSDVTPPGSGDPGFSCPIQLGACCTNGSCAGTMNENLCLEEYVGQWYQDEDCIGEPGFDCPLPACAWDNGPWDGDESSRGLSPPDFLQRRAVNGIFFNNDCTIDRFTAQVVEDDGWQPGDSVTVFVYRSVKGQPVSTPEYEVTVPLTTRTLIGEYFDARGVYEYVVENLGLDVAANTSYWIGFRNDAGSGDGSNYWLPASGGNNFGEGGFGGVGWISDDDGATWISDFIQFSFTIE